MLKRSFNVGDKQKHSVTNRPKSSPTPEVKLVKFPSILVMEIGDGNWLQNILLADLTMYFNVRHCRHQHKGVTNTDKTYL